MGSTSNGPHEWKISIKWFLNLVEFFSISQDNMATWNILGKFGLGSRYADGDRLVNFASVSRLVEPLWGSGARNRRISGIRMAKAQGRGHRRLPGTSVKNAPSSSGLDDWWNGCIDGVSTPGEGSTCAKPPGAEKANNENAMKWPQRLLEGYCGRDRERGGPWWYQETLSDAEKRQQQACRSGRGVTWTRWKRHSRPSQRVMSLGRALQRTLKSCSTFEHRPLTNGYIHSRTVPM